MSSLYRIHALWEANQRFAFQTTFATKIYRNKIRFAQAEGFNVTSLFFLLRDVHLAFERVKKQNSASRTVRSLTC